mmetsp:Transcript_2765/g.7800  ORF Transcript_2765/g.7800 Transcript_2765/m.7800 type:complete len:497 (+) Transcript_2765:160-1650(+)
MGPFSWKRTDESFVGCLADRAPAYARHPPIEAVVFGWGVNEDCQLGLDEDRDQLTPKVVDSLLGTQLSGRGFCIEPIVTGSRGTLAIGADGQLWSWGWNARGTLGHGHRDNVPKPSMVEGLEHVRVVQAAIGGWHSICVTDQGQMYAFGGNEYGQCGSEDLEGDVIVPRPIMEGIKVKQVSAGGMHSIALTDSGQVLMWGERWGDFSLVVQRHPSYLPGIKNIAKISAGAFHNLALTRDGEVLSWGTNDFGQLGIGTTEYATDPVSVWDLEKEIADVVAGGWHSLAINKDGEVLTWGRGEYGRLGVGDRSGSVKLRPCHVVDMSNHFVVQASCGGTHTMLLTDQGRMFVTGRGSFGRLGIGMKDHYAPVEVELPGGKDKWKVVSVAAGGRHSLCLAVPHGRKDRNPITVYQPQLDRRDTGSTGSLADREDGEFDDNGDGCELPGDHSVGSPESPSAGSLVSWSRWAAAVYNCWRGLLRLFPRRQFGCTSRTEAPEF